MSTPRVVVVALNYKPAWRVRSYTADLVEAGVQVDLLVPEANSTADVELDPRVRVHRLFEREAKDLRLRRIEHGILFTVPGRVIGKARRLLGDRPALQKVDAGLAFTGRAQKWVGKGIHRKLFWPTFKKFRPVILSNQGRDTVRELDLAGADRIVAADASAIPMVWKLARRYPDVRATTALDRKPYISET